MAGIATSHAQKIKIYSNGTIRVGHDYLEDHGMGGLYDPDPITRIRIFGPGEWGQNARISFGAQWYDEDKTVLVGEAAPDLYSDTDQIWLHGKKGLCVTFNSQASDTVIQFSPLGDDQLKVSVPVVSPQFLVSSDARFKDNVAPVEQALDALSGLSSVSYHFKGREVNFRPQPSGDDAKSLPDDALFEQFYANRDKGDIHYGFIAQQVQQVMPELVRTDANGYMYVDYIGVIPLLVNAVQELQSRLEQVEGAERQAPESHAPRQTTGTDDVLADMASEVLGQNTPNPFTVDTRIDYRLPEGTRQAAIYVFDLQGKQVDCLPITDMGTGSVTLEGGRLAAGMYIYSLLADGKELASKKMILTR